MSDNEEHDPLELEALDTEPLLKALMAVEQVRGLSRVDVVGWGFGAGAGFRTPVESVWGSGRPAVARSARGIACSFGPGHMVRSVVAIGTTGGLSPLIPAPTTATQASGPVASPPSPPAQLRQPSRLPPPRHPD